MRVLRTVSEVREVRADAQIVALVPTMGAFHEGHLALMRHAASLADTVIVSLFVNPTQFGPSDDFKSYPRDEGRDVELASEAGADYVFAPSVEEMYKDRSTTVRVTGVSERWEGEHRPGHFDGVATVVAKLLNIASPNFAVFGLKDLQQCAVVRALVKGLDFSVRLEFLETVRDQNGLALSSRNAYLDETQRAQAGFLFRALMSCAQIIRDDPSTVEQCCSTAVSGLSEHGFTVEYLACVDPATMEPSHDLAKGLRLICAVRFHGVRLIDNVPV